MTVKEKVEEIVADFLNIPKDYLSPDENFFNYVDEIDFDVFLSEFNRYFHVNLLDFEALSVNQILSYLLEVYGICAEEEYAAEMALEMYDEI